jgi:hypothetical protein
MPWAAQMAQTEELMFQNVAYRPTVYKTGAATNFPSHCRHTCYSHKLKSVNQINMHGLIYDP